MNFAGGLPSPETVLAAVVLAASFWAGQAWTKRLGWWERPLARLARRKRLAIAAAAVAPLIVRAALLPWFPMPQPRIHDEFSFLLGADTFAHGRLVNPEHPFWAHFESIHILVRPVYATAFPIAQAAVLALGEVLFGQPWAGVWLSTGLLCGALCWMLQGWLPPRWALLGAVMALLRLGISSYWMNSYWGGSMAGIGGALVLGALPRVMRAPGWRPSVTMGLGLVILANSRPVEGAVFGAGIAVVLFGWIWRRAGGVPWREVVAPLVVVLALAAGGVGYYFARVTGKPWEAPYVLYRNTMSTAPHFLWQKPTPPPLYESREVRDFYVDWEMLDYREARQWWGQDLLRKIAVYGRFYVGPLWAIPLLSLPWLWRDRRTRQFLLLGAVFCLALVGQVWHNAHYAAPATGLAVLILVIAMRRFRLWRWRGRAVGLAVVRLLPAAGCLVLLVQIGAGRAEDSTLGQRSWRWPSPGGVARAQVLSNLMAAGGKHLVFVRYGKSHDPGNEWVYNDADIDGAPVVWARELDRSGNAALMRYFADRKVWVVDPDARPAVPVPYDRAPERLMRFVQLGAPGIPTLHDVDEVRRAVLARAPRDTPRTCDLWNFLFAQATGVAGPEITEGCYGRDRAAAVPFEHWFTWLQGQR